jgi:glutamine synthetase
LNASIASPSNEHRLGAHEAPPAIISAFLGEHIDEVINSLVEERSPSRRASVAYEKINVGSSKVDLKVAHLPEVKRDLTDRNRTSPFAFTGNKFEFRAVGSSQSPSFPVTMLNSIAAAGMKDVIAALKAKKGSKERLSQEEILGVLKGFFAATERVRFEGNNYSAEWVQEAEKRGLLNAKDAPQAFAELIKDSNKKMLVEDLGIVSASELNSRYHVLCEKYAQFLVIEARTMASIATQNISPVAFNFCKEIAAGHSILIAHAPKLDTIETRNLPRLLTSLSELANAVDELEEAISKTESGSCEAATARLAADHLKPAINKTRSILDSIETRLADDAYPFPKYRELLF